MYAPLVDCNFFALCIEKLLVMTSIVHQDSQNAPLPDGPSVAFSVVNTCDAVTENDKFVEVRSIADPKNTSSEGQVIEWNVSGPAAGEYYSLKDSYFYFRYKFLQSADASATNPVVLNASYADPHDQVAPVQGFTSLLFSRFEMDINSTPVASQMSEYALCNYMHQLTTRTGRDLKAREFEEGWQRDSSPPPFPPPKKIKNEEIRNRISGPEGQNFDSEFPAPHT